MFDQQVIQALYEAATERHGWAHAQDVVVRLQAQGVLDGRWEKNLAKVKRTLDKLERNWFVWRRVLYTTTPTRTGTFAGIGSMRRRKALYSLSPAGRDALTQEV